MNRISKVINWLISKGAQMPRFETQVVTAPYVVVNHLVIFGNRNDDQPAWMDLPDRLILSQEQLEAPYGPGAALSELRARKLAPGDPNVREDFFG